MNRRNVFLILSTFILTLFVTGCNTAAPVTPTTRASVTLTADGTTQTFIVEGDEVVNDILREAGVTLDTLDRVEPPGYSRVEDGMSITVVRMTEETFVSEEIVPFSSRTVPNEGLEAGETQLLQPGENGTAEITYRVTYEDGVEVSRSEVRRTVITPAKDEVIMVGRQSDLPTVTVNGTLAYIYNGNAWVMRQTSANRLPLTLDGGLDGKVFELSADGGRLLFTRGTPDAAAGADFNTLWAVLDTASEEAQPLDLGLKNILYAAWVPGTARTIIYSTAEPRDSFPGWQANNDLWRAQISDDGQITGQVMLLEAWAGGVYGWYGTTFAYAPDGVTLAWAQPDAVGVLTPVYIEEEAAEGEEDAPTPEPTATPLEPDGAAQPSGYERQTLLSFAPWNAYDFVWVPTPIWSSDGSLILTPVHGEPLGNEQPEDSPLFSLVALSTAGGYSVNLVEQAGMWAEPHLSPDGAQSLDVQLAYLQAEEPLESINGRYRLVIMDRDGSNRQAIFPAANQPGLLSQSYTWSPDGRQIALVNPGPEGALLLVDSVTGLAQQVTDGQTSTPRWAP